VDIYNKFGQKIKTQLINENDSLAEWEVNKYDRNSRLIRTKYYNYPRKLRKITKFHYDNNGLLIKKTDLSVSTKKLDREIYTYNSDGILTEFHDYWGGELKIRDTYSINPKGQYTQKIRYCPNGDTLFFVKYYYPTDDLIEENYYLPAADTLSFTLLKKFKNGNIIERTTIRDNHIRNIDRFEYNQNNQLTAQIQTIPSLQSDLIHKTQWTYQLDDMGKPINDFIFNYIDGEITIQQKTEYIYTYY